MAGASGERLDESLWEHRGALRTRGPNGFASAVAMGTDNVVYAPLYEWQRTAPDLPSFHGGEVVVLRDRNHLADDPVVVGEFPLIAKKSLIARDEGWLGVLFRQDGTTQSFMLAHADFMEPHIAQLRYWWFSRAAARNQAAMTAVWLRLQHELVLRGFVGVTTILSDDTQVRQLTKRLGIFRTPEELLGDHRLTDMIE